MLRGRNIAAGNMSSRAWQRCRPWASTLHHSPHNALTSIFGLSS